MEGSGSRVGRSGGLGSGGLWRARSSARDAHSRSGWAGAWVRRCLKGHARVQRGPGTGPGLEGGEEVCGQGSCSRPPHPYPPPRSRRSARCRCPPPAAAPAAASCCARGRPWPARRAQRAQPDRPLARRPPRARSSRGQVESDAAPPPTPRQPRLPRASPAPRPFRPAPGACRQAWLLPFGPRRRRTPPGGSRALGRESLELARQQTPADHMLVSGLWTTQSASLASVSTSAKATSPGNPP